MLHRKPFSTPIDFNKTTQMHKDNNVRPCCLVRTSAFSVRLKVWPSNLPPIWWDLATNVLQISLYPRRGGGGSALARHHQRAWSLNMPWVLFIWKGVIACTFAVELWCCFLEDHVHCALFNMEIRAGKAYQIIKAHLARTRLCFVSFALQYSAIKYPSPSLESLPRWHWIHC